MNVDVVVSFEAVAHDSDRTLLRARVSDICLSFSRSMRVDSQAEWQLRSSQLDARDTAASGLQDAGLDPPLCLALRHNFAMPALTELHAWLLATQRVVAVGSGSGTARQRRSSTRSSAGRRWPALQRYAISGSLPIDNNPVEKVIRPIAIDNKNCLFTGSERAGRPAALAIQSLSTPPNSDGLMRRAGWPSYWNVSRRAPTARLIRCCHSPTLRNAERTVQMGPLAAHDRGGMLGAKAEA